MRTLCRNLVYIIKPNWFGSIHSSIKDLSSRSITNPSATLDSVDVRDMGLKSLLKSSIEAPLPGDL